MGEQLDLFGYSPAQPTEPLVVESEDESVAAPPESLPGQMDLFGDRWLRAASAHKALERFDLNAAAEALREAVRLYPKDTPLVERAELVAKLAGTLRGARRKKKSPAQALAALGPKVPAFLLQYWHRRLAELMEEEDRAGAVLDGVPAGLHWLRCGEPGRAEASLRATLDRDPLDGRARGYLGDALFVQGRQPEARIVYRDALAMAPAAVDVASVADVAVRDLPGLAELEYELPGPPVEWAAAIGLLEGVFMLPPVVFDNWVDEAVLRRLAPGVQFYRWLVAEKMAQGDAQRIGSRRAMKALSPRLLKELLSLRK